MRKYLVRLLALVLMTLLLAGCGETISGMGKDASRIGKGVKTVFIRDN